MIPEIRELLTRALALLGVVALSFAAGAEEKYFAVVLDSDDGLPHNAVYRINQTPDGYLWLGTSAGLARFDGLQFKRIDSPLLRSAQTDSVRQMVVANDGSLLVAPAIGGVLTIRSGEVFTNAVTQHITGERIASLHTTRDGGLWISLLGGNLCRWQDGRFERIGRLHTSGSGRVTMAEDGRGVLWISVGDYLGFWKDGFQRVHISLRPSYHLTPGRDGIWVGGEDGVIHLRDGNEVERFRWAAEMSQVTTIFEQANGEFWAGTTDTGLFRREKEKFIRAAATHPEISCLTEDREGNLWAGTVGGGAYMIRRQYVNVFDSRSGLPQDVTFSICEGPDQTVWFANRSGGLLRWRNEAFEVFAQPSRSLPGPVSINVNQHHSIYLGADTGLYFFQNPETHEVKEVTVFRGRGVRCLYTSRKNETWMATRSKFGRIDGIDFHEHGLDKQEDAFVSAIAEDSTGRIFAGTSSGELFRQAGDRFEKVALSEKLPLINALAPHDDGSLWMGCSGSGLAKWRDGTVRIFAEGKGPPDNVVTQLLWEDSTTLWGGSRSGIWRLDVAQLESKEGVYPFVLGKSDGAPGGSCMGSQQPVCFKSRDGSLWFATRRGVVRVDPSGFRKTRDVPPILIETLKVDGKNFPIKSVGQAPPGSERFEIQYNALSFASADRLRFRYRLDGYESDWVDAGARREAIYQRLPPGEYRFRVQAQDPHNEWIEKEPTLAFHVLPAWWQKVWVQVAISLAFAGLIALVVRSIVSRQYRQKLAVEAERARIARDLHDDMGAGLTHLVHLGHVASHDSEQELRESLSRVSERARELSVQMDAIVWTVNPKNDSLEQLASYLSHFGQEMFRNCSTRLRVDRPQEFPSVAVSPEFRHHVLMLVKEAMNNVAKHSDAAEAWLRIDLAENQLRIEVEDSGQGISEGLQNGGEGLSNMKSRAAEIGGELEIGRGSRGGTVVRLRALLK